MPSFLIATDVSMIKRKDASQIQDDIFNIQEGNLMDRDYITHCRRSNRYGSTMRLLLILSVFALNPNHAISLSAGSSVADLASEVSHSVVNIYTTQLIEASPMMSEQFGGGRSREFFEDLFNLDRPPTREANTLGSGFVISTDGLILTNFHVVARAEEIRVRLENGQTYDAEIVGTDPRTDLALIKIEVKEALAGSVQLGDSDSLRVGDGVMAVGNPFGLGHSVTTGIVSAKGRLLGAGPYDDFLQTDAAINPGNSGGPLFNMDGEVVGISTAIVAGGQGIGFAIPINLAVELLPQLKTGRVVRGWLGVMIQDITQDLAEYFNLPFTEGALVSDVTSDGPAKQAGVRRGDVIFRVNGQEVEQVPDLSRMIAEHQPGTQIDVGIIREGQRRTIPVTLGTLPEVEIPRAAVEKSNDNNDNGKMGLTVQDFSPQLAIGLGLPPGEGGVVVVQVQPGSPASRAGFRPGDLIQEMNQEPIEDTSAFARQVSERTEELTLFLVKRGEGMLFLVLRS
jgi:serine protease Do